MNKLLAITDDQHFKKEVLEADLPVLVDFWADWCNPCKVILPYVEAIAEQYKNQLHVVKVDIDKLSNIASEYAVRGIPTLILFQKGSELDRSIGVKSQEELVDFLKNQLSNF